MKITYYTNTMLLMESAATRVLCDPWITFDRKSTSGFYNFPESRMTPEQVAAIRPDFIYITHTHPDHFDPTTLHLLNPMTPVLVAEYQENFTARMIRKMGFSDVRIVPLDEGLPLHGADHVWLEPAARSPEVDSIALFRLDSMTAVNANDNSFDEAQNVRLRERCGDRIDVGLLPSGAHGPWPMFFDNLTSAEKHVAAEVRALNQKRSFTSYIEALRPRWVVPIAGGVICSGAKVREYRYSGISPRSEVVAYAHEHAETPFEDILLSEGNVYDFSIGVRTGEYVEKTYESEHAYLSALSQQPSLFGPSGQFYIAEQDRIDLSRLLTIARANLRRWQQKKNTSSTIAFFFDTQQSELYRLSLAEDHVTRVREADITDERYEIFRLPYELLVGLLTRHYIWSNVKTQHVTYHRKGDRMDRDLMLLLNYLQV